MWYRLIIPAVLAITPLAAQAADVVLIDRELQVKRVGLVSFDDQRLTIQGPRDRVSHVAIGDIIALAVADTAVRLPDAGLLELADGQRLPGEAIAVSVDEDVLPWRHPLLGRIDVPLDDIATVRFRYGMPLPDSAEADAVLLTNGDRLEGFVVSLGDPIVLEVINGPDERLLEIPHRNIASLRMVAPAQHPSNTRLWLTDGTIVDARSIEIEESGRVRLLTMWQAADAAPTRLMLIELAAILIHPAQLQPLAVLPALRVEGPVTRYEVPPPTVLDDSAVLGLSSIEYRGPLVVRYALPRGAKRFAAEGVLPPVSRAWGDYELVISDQMGERFRQRMHAGDPVATINIELADTPGVSELTIELREGTYGGIQDHLILNRPMLLVDP